MQMVLHKKFDDSVRKVLKKHEIQDEKLEPALIDLFNAFQSHLLRDGFADDVIARKDRQDNRNRRRPGRV